MSTETPEQRAREIAAKHTRGRQPAQALLLLDIEAAIRAAVAAETERCAKVADMEYATLAMNETGSTAMLNRTGLARVDAAKATAKGIAAAIRERRP